MARAPWLLRGGLLAGLTGLVLAPSPAAANNPAVKACEGKSEGQACGLETLVKPEGGGELQRTTVPGACRADECCDLDYSKGSPPETVCHACLACKEGPGAAPAPDAKGAEGKADGAEEPPRAAQAGPPPASPSEQRGCTVGASSNAPTSGLWLLLLLAPRRRRG